MLGYLLANQSTIFPILVMAAAAVIALLVLGTLQFVRGALHTPQFFRWQVYAIMAAVIIPWTANLATNLDWQRFR